MFSSRIRAVLISLLHAQGTAPDTASAALDQMSGALLS